MNKYLIVGGEGGCWSGYPLARVVEASNKDEGLSMAHVFVNEYSESERRGEYFLHGVSFDAMKIETTVEKCPLYSRLKPEAKKMLQYKI